VDLAVGVDTAQRTREAEVRAGVPADAGGQRVRDVGAQGHGGDCQLVPEDGGQGSVEATQYDLDVLESATVLGVVDGAELGVPVGETSPPSPGLAPQHVLEAVAEIGVRRVNLDRHALHCGPPSKLAQCNDDTIQ
jgi:hypothetical protein